MLVFLKVTSLPYSSWDWELSEGGGRADLGGGWCAHGETGQNGREGHDGGEGLHFGCGVSEQRVRDLVRVIGMTGCKRAVRMLVMMELLCREMLWEMPLTYTSSFLLGCDLARSSSGHGADDHTKEIFVYTTRKSPKLQATEMRNQSAASLYFCASRTTAQTTKPVAFEWLGAGSSAPPWATLPLELGTL